MVNKGDEIDLDDAMMIVAFQLPYVRQFQQLEVMRSFLAATKSPEWFSEIFERRDQESRLFVFGENRMGELILSLRENSELPQWFSEVFAPQRRKFTIFHLWGLCQTVRSFQPYSDVVRTVLAKAELMEGSGIVFELWKSLDGLREKRMKNLGDGWNHLRPYLMTQAWSEIDRFQEQGDCCSMKELIERAMDDLDADLAQRKSKDEIMEMQKLRDRGNIFSKRKNSTNLPALNLDWWERVFPLDGRRILPDLLSKADSISQLFKKGAEEGWSHEKLTQELSQVVSRKLVSLWF